MPKLTKQQTAALKSVEKIGYVIVAGLSVIDGAKVQTTDLAALLKAGFIEKTPTEDSAKTKYVLSNAGKEYAGTIETGGLIGKWCVNREWGQWVVRKVYNERHAKIGFSNRHQIDLKGRGRPDWETVDPLNEHVAFCDSEAEAAAVRNRVSKADHETNKVLSIIRDINKIMDEFNGDLWIDLIQAAVKGEPAPEYDVFKAYSDAIKKVQAKHDKTM